jgi:hypothetical protein
VSGSGPGGSAPAGGASAARARVVDEALRRRALEVLGALGAALARDALESGSVEVEHDVLTWQGSHGPVRAHRVIVSVERVLHAQLLASHAARDGLVAALSAAMAERRDEAVADVRLEQGSAPSSSGPYRDRDPRG